jgi:hypothetical protein
MGEPSARVRNNNNLTKPVKDKRRTNPGSFEMRKSKNDLITQIAFIVFIGGVFLIYYCFNSWLIRIILTVMFVIVVFLLRR